MTFSSRYTTLNEQQRKAVDTIDGPVMVVAGPGTGKTELLSMRAANILQKTDVLPENILCLTFTESGSNAMQQRLSSIIGREAYNVSIHTFHAFGSEIMNRHREYFYNGAQFRPADELNQRRILTDILKSLPHDNPLGGMMNGEYSSMNDIKSAISDIKRSGLSEEELLAILDANDTVIQESEPLLADIFSARIGKATFEKLLDAAGELAAIDEPQPVLALPRLSDVLRRSLQHALARAAEHPKTTPPLTEWKKQWLATNARKEVVLKASLQQGKLRTLLHIYSLYQAIMQEAELFDFDDMIAQVVQALELRPELRYELQEKYQYIMVDEFQDTNLAQMRILLSLTESAAHEGTPNILVVGDDDQAIYGFQGADVSNILSFRTQYPDATLITLTDNYRSAPRILDAARAVITQGEERLEAQLEELDKTLKPHASAEKSGATLITTSTVADERSWITSSIKEQLQHTSPGEIAVIARRHTDLEALVPYFAEAKIPISYDKRDNILEDEVIVQLELLARLTLALKDAKLDLVESLLPQLLCHPAWGITPELLWRISLGSYQNKTHWLETLRLQPETTSLHQWLVRTAMSASYTPLERIMDILMGEKVEDETTFTSPLKTHFFSSAPETYYHHLANLSALRTKLREHLPDTTAPRLEQFIEFLEQMRAINGTVTTLRHIGEDSASVRLMSAHASKGLEFDTVYVINAVDSNWGNKAGGRTSTISYPENMRLRQNTNSLEERLRLFFVAMTRAKRQLFISHADSTQEGKELMRASFLVGEHTLTEHKSTAPEERENTSHTVINEWYAPVLELAHADMQAQLAPILERYKLSATHINNFIDVTRGGPQHFLLSNLLHFPSARTPHAGFGTAMHAALQQAHDYLRAHGAPQPEEDIVRTFEQTLANEQLTEDERTLFTARGSESLRTFLQQRYQTFTPSQHAELNLAYQNIQLGEARLTGKLDVADISKKERTIAVTDYKTGKALSSWEKGADYQKIKAHKYRQQLLFYRLLLAHSREWRNYTLTKSSILFVEPDKSGEIIELALGDVSGEELEEFTQLIQAVWRHIQQLIFPDTSQYEATLSGIRAFEQDLRSGKI